MDIKHVLSTQPAATRPTRRGGRRRPRRRRAGSTGRARPGGLAEIGHDGDGFAFDNEAPRHTRLARAVPHRRPARHQRRLARVHRRRRLPAGPSCGCPTAGPPCRPQGWEAPLYWERDGDGWADVHPLGRAAGRPGDRSCHVSYYEADAFARWAGGPAADRSRVGGAPRTARRSTGAPRPRPAAAHRRLASRPRRRLGVDASAYLPYPGFRPASGRGRRVQRQVHGATSTVLRGGVVRRHRAGHVRADVPQLLPAGRPLGVQRRSGSPRRLSHAASPDPRGSPMTADRLSPIDVHLRPDDLPRPPGRRMRRPASPRRRRRCRRCGSTTSAAASCSTRSPGLPEYYPTRAERAILDRARGRDRRPLAAPTRWSSSARARRRRPALLLDALADAGPLQPLRPVRRERGRRCGDAAADDRRPRTGHRRARGRRRLPPPPRCDPARRPPARRVPREHDRQPRTRRERPRFLADLDATMRPRRLAAARHRPGEGSRPARAPPTTTRPASPPRSTATCSGAEPRARRRLRPRTRSTTSPAGTTDDAWIEMRLRSHATSNSSRSTISR